MIRIVIWIHLDPPAVSLREAHESRLPTVDRLLHDDLLGKICLHLKAPRFDLRRPARTHPHPP
jgi:hypothetical protein